MEPEIPEKQSWIRMKAEEIEAAAKAGAAVMLPIGAVEQHGRHLPVDTDIAFAQATAAAVAANVPNTLVAPPVWWGLSGTHQGFPGLLSLRLETFLALLNDLCKSIADQGFERIVLVVAHGSNRPAVSAFVTQFKIDHGVGLMQLNCTGLGASTFVRLRRSARGGEAHAGEFETSLMLHLRPDAVDLGSAVGHPIEPTRDFGHSEAPADAFEPSAVTIGYQLRERFPTGVMGDPLPAAAETGQKVWEAIVERGTRIVQEWVSTDDPFGSDS